ncbi:DUF6114 domain-containing protein [Micromonosporaceae bacterium Da 78-11]
MATDNFWGKFRLWRRHRPFWGGLLLLLSGLELLYSSNASLAGLELHLGPQGFLSYLLPLLLLVCGTLCWFSPSQRLFYGIIALLTALYSFIGLNLGGFFIGMLLGIIGGALVIAWGPPRIKPGDPLIDLPPDGSPSDHDADEHDTTEPYADEPYTDEPAAEDVEVAGHDDRPHEPVRPAGQGFVPGFADAPAPRGAARLAKNPKTMVIALVPLALTASLLVAGSRTPASADDCPEGLPSRSYETSAPAASSASSSLSAAKRKAASASASAAASASKKATAKPKSAAPSGSASRSTSGSAKATASASPSLATAEEEGSGNVILEGINDVVDGVSNLLGLGDEESPSPSTSPSPSETPTTAPTSAPTSAPATTPESAPASSADSTPSSTPATSSTATKPASSAAASSATALPTASGDVIPCLGPRVLGKIAGADDLPRVAEKPGLMEVDSLTLYNSTYDGVVDMPTAKGSYKALKFSMTKATNKPFTLTMIEAGGGRTRITSANLVTEGTVKFYTPELKGKLFGLIPVTFTPDSPPPLTLPILRFTDVQIQLAYVRCDTLTGDPLKVAAIK